MILFGRNTGSGGADKLGHAFISYAISNVLTERLQGQGVPVDRAALSAAISAQAVMLYVEVFDGYSNDHGFAREDLVMNLLGSGFAYARAVTPGLREKMDFRLEYQSSGYKGFRPISDYEGQKYLLALKLGGFKAFQKTPLRYLELQAGYYTRGFSQPAQLNGASPKRYTFIGFGLNLNELLLGQKKADESPWRDTGRMFLEHIQLPHASTQFSWSH